MQKLIKIIKWNDKTLRWSKFHKNETIFSFKRKNMIFRLYSVKQVNFEVNNKILTDTRLYSVSTSSRIGTRFQSGGQEEVITSSSRILSLERIYVVQYFRLIFNNESHYGDVFAEFPFILYTAYELVTNLPYSNDFTPLKPRVTVG
jgi:hypothetical protein